MFAVGQLVDGEYLLHALNLICDLGPISFPRFCSTFRNRHSMNTADFEVRTHLCYTHFVDFANARRLLVEISADPERAANAHLGEFSVKM